MRLDATDKRLIDGWQRDFPLQLEPFAVIGASLTIDEAEVRSRLARLRALGAIARVGVVLRPNRAGASTLAALFAHERRLEEVAALVNEEPGVNHNYERENRWNLWFVVTGPDYASVRTAILRIEARTGLPVLELPLKRAFHIDLGFPVFASSAAPRKRLGPPPLLHETSAEDRRLLAALEEGLPLTPRPYDAVGSALGLGGAEVIARLRRMIDGGTVARLGLVVRHRALGFASNAMVVWDMPDERVESLAEAFAGQSFVTLCSERERRPHWPFNLYCMIHGRDRTQVEGQITMLAALAGGWARARDVLFSRRCFRQRGARLSAA